MFVPFISENRRTSRRKERRELVRRKGGGGKGAGGGGGGGSSSGGGGKGGGSAGGNAGSGIRQQQISAGGRTQSSSAYGNGGGPATTISSGAFAGRSQGGGTRGQVYGTSAYGSGYPGVAGRGVGGRGFPFYYWPIAWGGIGLGGAAYMHHGEYGRPDNSSRPGGVITYATFPASSGNTTFRVVSDNATVASLITDVRDNCTSSSLNAGSVSSAPIRYVENDPSMPQSESTVQYYRASSVSLTLDGYNNTAAFQDEGTPDTPIPTSVNRDLLNCLNYTIGAAAPLIDAEGDGDGDGELHLTPKFGLLALVFMVYRLCAL